MKVWLWLPSEYEWWVAYYFVFLFSPAGSAVSPPFPSSLSLSLSLSFCFQIVCHSLFSLVFILILLSQLTSVK